MSFRWTNARFASRGGNAFFKLTPGRQLYLSNQQCVATGKCDELEELWITVLKDTRTIVLTDDGRKRRIKHARRRRDGDGRRRAGRDLA